MATMFKTGEYVYVNGPDNFPWVMKVHVAKGSRRSEEEGYVVTVLEASPGKATAMLSHPTREDPTWGLRLVNDDGSTYDWVLIGSVTRAD